MVIWKAEGDEVKYFERQSEARKYISAYRKTHGRKEGSGPDKVTVKGRAELVALLNGAVGTAASDDVNEDEFI